MTYCAFVTGWMPALIVLAFAAYAVAEEPPLPQSGPRPGSPEPILKPTAIVHPPAAKPAAAPKAESARELALQAMERALIDEQRRKQVAAAAKQGSAAALKQLIVMAGPVDDAFLKSPKPPASLEGRVAIIGLKGGESVGKSLEQFFGAPLTPEREKELLETVRSQLAGKDQPGLEVSVAGWWPLEGVMAVSVVPKG